MKIEGWLKDATEKLRTIGIGSARLDSLILLEDELGRDRAWLLAHPETILQGSTLKKLNKKLAESGELRAESYIVDIGTGSGALGITAALELHNHNVDLYDIDASCLAVARHNAHMHELHLHCYKRDLLNRPVRPYDVLLANLPYVPDNWRINPAAAREPKLAIFGGPDGLDVYRRLFDQLNSSKGRTLREVRYVFTEALPPQHQRLAKIAEEAGYKMLKSQDFIQLFQ